MGISGTFVASPACVPMAQLAILSRANAIVKLVGKEIYAMKVGLENRSLYCNVLHCTVLYCNVLYCIALFCIRIPCNILYCVVLYCMVKYCIVMYFIAL